MKKIVQIIIIWIILYVCIFYKRSLIQEVSNAKIRQQTNIHFHWALSATIVNILMIQINYEHFQSNDKKDIIHT